MAIKELFVSWKDRINQWGVDHLTRISFLQKIFFVDHLRTMLHASISIVEALEILGKESTNKKMVSVVKKIKQEVEKGRSLSDVLGAYPELFPPIYVKMVESGELSGKLDESLTHIVVQMKKTQALTSSIRGAMIYPAVIVTAMVGIAIMMVTVILPRLLDVFKEFHAELPLATRILIRITELFVNPVAIVIGIFLIVIIVGGYIVLLKRSPPFRHAIHRIILRLPIAGSVARQINLARFSLTLSSLLKSTVPIIDAVDITADTCTNVLYRDALHDAAKKIKTGAALSDILREYPRLFSPMVTEMIMVGERSGQMDNLLTELSIFFSDEVDKIMKNFTTIIEPVIIIGMGIAVAGLAVAVIMPMYSLVQNF